ncbi:MAG: hypothetical protein HY685_07075 [Chloroflexi bacterium]|nr:hypothetical protein [Chloroflexota bacterium]
MSTLLWLGGVSALLAIPALWLAGVFLALFFGGAGERYGPLNDIFSAIALLLLILPALAVYLLLRGQTGMWLAIVTGLAVAGILVAAGGQLLLVLGVIDLQTSFVTGGVGIAPVFLWLVALALLALGSGHLPAMVGWMVLAVLSLSVLLTLGSIFRINVATGVVSVALLLALTAWLVALGQTLLRQS